MSYGHSDYIDDLKTIFSGPKGEQVLKHMYYNEIDMVSYHEDLSTNGVLYKSGRRDFVQQLMTNIMSIEEIFKVIYK